MLDILIVVYLIGRKLTKDILKLIIYSKYMTFIVMGLCGQKLNFAKMKNVVGKFLIGYTLLHREDFNFNFISNSKFFISKFIKKINNK